MRPSEKAQELVDNYIKVTKTFDEIYGFIDDLETAKICAIIAVNEILNENSIREGDNDEIITYEPYWLKVKQEIEKL